MLTGVNSSHAAARRSWWATCGGGVLRASAGCWSRGWPRWTGLARLGGEPEWTDEVWKVVVERLAPGSNRSFLAGVADGS
jgi:hypothetical protein